MADKKKPGDAPTVIKNYREFKKTGVVNPTPPRPVVAPAAQIPEIIKVTPAVSPPVATAPVPLAPVEGITEEKVLEFLQQEKIPFLEVSGVSSGGGGGLGIPVMHESKPAVTPVDYSGISVINDGPVPGDPGKVIISGKEYSVAVEESAIPANSPAKEKEKPIITADVVDAYEPADSNIGMTVVVCIKPPSNFDPEKHPWLQDGAVALLQVRAVEMSGRSCLFLNTATEDLLYPLEFVFLKGGVLPVQRITTYNRITKEYRKNGDSTCFKDALVQYEELIQGNNSTYPVGISRMRTPSGDLYIATFNCFISSVEAFCQN